MAARRNAPQPVLFAVETAVHPSSSRLTNFTGVCLAGTPTIHTKRGAEGRGVVSVARAAVGASVDARRRLELSDSVGQMCMSVCGGGGTFQ